MAPDTNGTVVPFRELTPAEVKDLTGARISAPWSYEDRLFPSFDDGKVFDQGQSDARDLRGMLRQDGNARKVEQVLTLPIRSAAWEIRKAPGGDAEYQWIRAQFDARLDKVIDQMTTAITYRKAFFELTFQLAKDGSGVEVADIAWRPPATCEQGHDPQTGEPAGFRQRVAYPAGLWRTGNAGWQGQANGGVLRADLRQAETSAPGYVDIPQSRSFVFVHGSYREPIEGLSDLDVAWWAYSTAKKIQFLWFQFLEQQSLPKIVVYGDDPTQADNNADAYAAAKASGVIAQQRPSEPGARGFDIVESSGKGASQFLEALNYLEAKMSASVLAGFTDLAGISAHSRTGSGGSYALSADQSEFFLAARQAVADEIANAISADLFAKLVELQFGPDAKPPTLEIGPLSKRDKDRALSLLMSLLTADHYNAPPKLVDLLITSSAGYLGLPVDQVAQMVKDHPAKDPAEAPPAAPGVPGMDGSGVPGLPSDPQAPAGTAGGSVADAVDVQSDPLAAFKQLAGLAHQVDEYNLRTAAGEHPAVVIADITGHPIAQLELARYVRTEAGAKRYGLPIGSPIEGHAKPVAKTVKRAAAKPAPHSPPSAQVHDYARLKSLHAQAVKLGPNSKAGTDYAKALAAYKTKYPPKPAAEHVPEHVPEHLKALKAQADKLGPNSGAHAQYRKKLAEHQSAAPAAKPEPAASPAVKPVVAKAGAVTAEHKKTSLDGLSKPELAALRRYTGADYKKINNGLRKPSPNVNQTVRDIDSALEKKPLTQPTKVWRTVAGDAFGLSAPPLSNKTPFNPNVPVGDATSLKGKVFTEAGFMSTSVKNEQFGGGRPTVHLALEVPPGIGAAYLEPITQNPQENELLLQRGLRYAVTGVKWNPKHARWDVKARVLPPADSVAA